MYIQKYIHIHKHIQKYIHIHKYMYQFIYIHMHVYVNMYMYTQCTYTGDMRFMLYKRGETNILRLI
jgi:hypothetical protein